RLPLTYGISNMKLSSRAAARSAGVARDDTELIPQRLPGLQRVLHSLLRLLGPQQPQKSLPLERENIFFGDTPRRSVAPGEHIRELVRDLDLVLRNLSRFAHRPHGVLQVAERVLAHGRDRTRQR